MTSQSRSQVLVALYVLSFAGANVITAATMPVEIGPWLVTWGTWIVGFTFIIRDALHHRLGRRGVYRALAVGVAVAAAVSLLLGDTLLVLVASCLSIALAEATDTEVFARLRDRLGLSVAASGAAGALVDSIVFPVVGLGLSGIVPWHHGTPITPRTKLLELAGRSFCVSYAEPRDVEVCHEIGQSVMLDNGAFTIWRQGGTLDPEGFYAWAEPWLRFWTTWAVIPDVIEGDEDANDELIAAWPFGCRGAPVWHMHESIDRLVRLAHEWPLVCIGSSGAYANIGDAAWRRRMVAAMDTLCGDGPPPCALHMLRGLKFAGSEFPFASADSTSIARNHAGNNTRGTAPKDVRAMADEIDARQCPAVWRVQHEQMELAA